MKRFFQLLLVFVSILFCHEEVISSEEAYDGIINLGADLVVIDYTPVEPSSAVLYIEDCYEEPALEVEEIPPEL